MSRKTSQLNKFAQFDVADLNSATKNIAQSTKDFDGKWIALRVDGLAANVDSAALESFDDAITEHCADSVDVVLLVEAKESDEVLAAWEAAKIDAPASVLAKLPDAEDKACRYVALTGKRIDINLPDKDGSDDQLSEDDRAVLRTGLTDFVREKAEDVRAARAEVAAAVQSQSAANAFAGSIALDSAMDRLEVTCESGLPEAVATLDESAEPTDAPASVEARDAAQAKRDSALGEFAGASSKGGLGKLLAKSKIKTAGDGLLAATDAFVGARAAELIEDLIIQAEPLVRQSNEEARGQVLSQAVADLSEVTDLAASDLAQLSGVDPARIDRPWTSGVPRPRRYVIAESQILDQLELSIDVTKVPTEGFEGVYVLQAQHGLSASALIDSKQQ